MGTQNEAAPLQVARRGVRALQSQQDSYLRIYLNFVVAVFFITMVVEVWSKTFIEMVDEGHVLNHVLRMETRDFPLNIYYGPAYFSVLYVLIQVHRLFDDGETFGGLRISTFGSTNYSSEIYGDIPPSALHVAGLLSALSMAVAVLLVGKLILSEGSCEAKKEFSRSSMLFALVGFLTMAVSSDQLREFGTTAQPEAFILLGLSLAAYSFFHSKGTQSWLVALGLFIAAGSKIHYALLIPASLIFLQPPEKLRRGRLRLAIVVAAVLAMLSQLILRPLTQIVRQPSFMRDYYSAKSSSIMDFANSFTGSLGRNGTVILLLGWIGLLAAKRWRPFVLVVCCHFLYFSSMTFLTNQWWNLRQVPYIFLIGPAFVGVAMGRVSNRLITSISLSPWRALGTKIRPVIALFLGVSIFAPWRSVGSSSLNVRTRKSIREPFSPSASMLRVRLG